MSILQAGVAKLVYAPDSKSGVRQGHVGSSPTSGTSFSPALRKRKGAEYDSQGQARSASPLGRTVYFGSFGSSGTSVSGMFESAEL